MIEVMYFYHRNDGKIITHYAYFHRADRALRFIYKCIRSPKMVYGSVNCDDPYDQEWIESRIK